MSEETPRRLPKPGEEIAVFHSRYWYGPYLVKGIDARTGAIVVRHTSWEEGRELHLHDRSYGDAHEQWKYARDVTITA